DVNEEGLTCIKQGLERRFGSVVATATCDLTEADSVDSLLSIIDKYKIRFDMLLNVADRDFEGEFMKRDREDLVKIVLLNNAAPLRVSNTVIKRGAPGSSFSVIFVFSLASMYILFLKA